MWCLRVNRKKCTKRRLSGIMHISWLPKRTELWSWRLQHMCRLIPATSRLHTAFDFWSSAGIRIAYFCMPQTVPLFTSLAHLGLDPSAVGGGVPWEVLLSGWVMTEIDTTVFWNITEGDGKQLFVSILLAGASALKVEKPAEVVSAAWQQRKVLDLTFGSKCLQGHCFST